MNENMEQKLAMRNIPGLRVHERFGEIEHAKNAGAAMRRIVGYFIHEKTLVLCMLSAVIFGTLCGVYAPSLQSNAIDIIAGTNRGSLYKTLIMMLAVYLLLQRFPAFTGAVQCQAEPAYCEADERGSFLGKLLICRFVILIHIRTGM